LEILDGKVKKGYKKKGRLPPGRGNHNKKQASEGRGTSKNGWEEVKGLTVEKHM